MLEELPKGPVPQEQDPSAAGGRFYSLEIPENLRKI
jgi:hypothetical protein